MTTKPPTKSPAKRAAKPGTKAAASTPRRSTAAVRNPLKPRYYGKGSGVPDGIDIHVGARMRMRRSILGMSQEKIADALGITFQQVQKYEHGKNRISASRLYQMAQILDVPANFFFDGFSEKTPGLVYAFSDNGQEDFSWLEGENGDLMERKETIDLVRTYYQVQDEATRRNFVKMLKTLVASQGFNE